MTHYLNYDRFVQENCHDRKIMKHPKFGTLKHLQLFGRNPPVNGGTLMYSLNRRNSPYVTDDEREHGHFIHSALMKSKNNSYIEGLEREERYWTLEAERSYMEEVESRRSGSSQSGLNIDPWEEYEADTGITRQQYMESMGYVSSFDTRPISEMEGSHSSSTESLRLNTSPFSPDSSKLYFNDR